VNVSREIIEAAGRTDVLAAILDGKTELEPKAGSSNAFVFRIPPDTTPGEHTIEFKGAVSGQYKLGVLGVEGSIDQNQLWRNQSTTMRLRVIGTDERLPLEIVNKAPGTITVDGGSSQVITSPGGANNAITRSVTGIRKGDFNIEYSLNLPACGVVPPQ
jgi:hypothetical protein